MRILTVTNLYPTPFHPTRGIFNRQKIQILAARFPVSVIAPILWTDELMARWKGQPPLPPGRRVVHDGIPVEHPRYYYPPKVLRGWYGRFFREAIRPAFRRALAEFRPDLVYASWAYPDGWAAVQLAREAGLPVVVQVLGSDIHQLGTYPRRMGGTMEALRLADGLISVSRDLVDRMVELGLDRGRIRVIYNGVDVEKFRPGPRDEARARLAGELELRGPSVLYIGNLVPIKGLDGLLDALARLAGQGVEFTAILIGQGPLRPYLEAKIEGLGLGGRVKLLGPRPHAHLPDWYRASDLLVLPSHAEGMPNVLLEAAACGTPFVASRVGGIPEIAQFGPSRLVAPGNVDELAAAIRDGLEGRIGPGPGEAGWVRSYERTVAEIIDVFEQVLAARGPSPRTLERRSAPAAEAQADRIPAHPRCAAAE